MNDWNNLPNYVVNSLSINTFKSLLDSYSLNLRLFLYKMVGLMSIQTVVCYPYLIIIIIIIFKILSASNLIKLKV